MLWDFLATLGATILIIGMVAEAYLPVWVALPMIVVFVVFKAVARATGRITGFIYYPFMISFFGALAIFALLKGGAQHLPSVVAGVAGQGVVTVVSQLLRLATEGHVSMYVAGIAIVALVLARWLGLQLRSKLIYHSIFSIGAPIFVLLVFLATASGGEWREAFMVGGSLLAHMTVLEGLYIMIFGLLKRNVAQ
jgi:hypothetical protein